MDDWILIIHIIIFYAIFALNWFWNRDIENKIKKLESKGVN